VTMKWALSRKNAWERTPRWVKGALAPLLQRLPVERCLGQAFRRHLAFLRQAQWWSADEARAHQLEEVRRICRHALAASPFYRQHFAGAGFDPRDLRSLDDLRRLPTIDKDTVIEHLHAMCTVPADAPGVDYVTTGGTGGVPFGFYINAQRSSVEYAHLVAGWERAGYRLGTPLAVFRGRVVQENGRGFRHEHDPLLRHHYYSGFHLSDVTMAAYLAHVATLGPCFLHVYPSSAVTLARFLRRTRTPAPTNVRGILAESEILYPDQRRLLGDIFQCPVFSSYGHSEKLVAAAGCEQTAHYHVWPTYGHCELVDAAGQAVTTPGQRGEIVGTGFINTVVPFIRYRTGDRATYVGDHCVACGRAHLLLDDIRGHRVQEVLVAGDGHLISWTALNMHDDTFDRVLQFQFVQEVAGTARLRLVPAADFSPDDEARVRARLVRKLDGQVNFTIERCNEIARSPRGKAIYIDQRIANVSPADTD